MSATATDARVEELEPAGGKAEAGATDAVATGSNGSGISMMPPLNL